WWCGRSPVWRGSMATRVRTSKRASARARATNSISRGSGWPTNSSRTRGWPKARARWARRTRRARTWCRRVRRARCCSATLAFVLQDVQPRVPVADEQQSVFLHEDVGRLRRERDVRPRVDQLLRRRRNPRREFLRRELIADVEHADAGDVVSRKKRLLAL